MKRKILRIAGILLLAVATFIGYAVFQSLREFRAEDLIHGTFHPVIRALDSYGEEHGKAPQRLEDLVPAYLDAVPSAGMVSEVQYLPDPAKPNWRLTLVSRTTGCKRLYIAESGMPLTAGERKDLVLRYHSRWNVLEPEP